MCHILVAGGDMRNVYLAGVLSGEGFKVGVCGFDEDVRFDDNIARVKDIKKAAGESNVIVLPLPVSFDNITLNTPYSHECIYINDILSYATKNCIVTGGRVSGEIIKKYGTDIIDYAKRDDFAYLNSVPTAEGAIEAAMKETPVTIAGSLCMVTGFGKCSETLALTLKAMNARVHVFARSAKDLSHAACLGFESFHLSELEKKIKSYDMIFNSVPFGIFSSECTDKIKPSSVFIDIASAPGGISCDADKEKINYHFLPGLPGKYSPYTAAEIIKKVISAIMRENERMLTDGF